MQQKTFYELANTQPFFNKQFKVLHLYIALIIMAHVMRKPILLYMRTAKMQTNPFSPAV